MKKEALVLIDIQNIYFEEGNYKLYRANEASLKAKKVLEHFRACGKSVIHIKHNFKVNGVSMAEKNRVCDFHKNVTPINHELTVEKEYPNGFLRTNLQETLQKLGIEKLIVVGMMSHMCIDTTVRAAQNYGYEVVVLEDACTTKNLNTAQGEVPASVVHNVFMAALNGMFANVMKVEDYIV